MPMPPTITGEDIARWDKSWKEFNPASAGLPAVFKTIPGFKERVWYTGEWLGEQLAALECPAEEAKSILTACGQRQAVASDAWVSAVEALDDYKKGTVNTNVPTMLVANGSISYISDGNRENSCKNE